LTTGRDLYEDDDDAVEEVDERRTRSYGQASSVHLSTTSSPQEDDEYISDADVSGSVYTYHSSDNYDDDDDDDADDDNEDKVN